MMTKRDGRLGADVFRAAVSTYSEPSGKKTCALSASKGRGKWHGLDDIHTASASLSEGSHTQGGNSRRPHRIGVPMLRDGFLGVQAPKAGFDKPLHPSDEHFTSRRVSKCG